MVEATDLLHEVERIATLLQALQENYDHEMWEIQSPPLDKLRHIELHLCVTVGKLAAVIEPIDHANYRGDNEFDPKDLCANVSPLLADLLIYSLQIANLVGGNIGAMLLQRYRNNGKRFAPESVFARL